MSIGVGDFYQDDPEYQDIKARIRQDAYRGVWLAADAAFYDTLPGRDDAFSQTVHESLLVPLDADGYIDTDRYPPPGHGFPAVM